MVANLAGTRTSPQFEGAGRIESTAVGQRRPPDGTCDSWNSCPG